MPIFTLNFVSIFLWAFLIYRLPYDKKKKDIIFLTIIFIQFTLLAWQRDYNVGYDTYGYYGAFERISKLDFRKVLEYRWDKGYVLLNWVIAKLGFNFHSFLLFSGAFIYFSLVRFIYKYSNSPWISILVFLSFGYYFQSLYILRQFIAIAIILYSYQFIIQQRGLYFCLTVLIASCFHSSAIIFMPSFFLAKIKIRNSNSLIILFFIVAIIEFLFGDIILSKLIFNTTFAKRYLNTEHTGAGYAMLLLLFSIMSMAVIYKPPKLSVKQNVFYLLFFCSLCFQPLATFISMISRQLFYWLMSSLIVIPMIIDQIPDRRDKRMAYIVTIGGLILFFFLVSNRNEGINEMATFRWYIEKV